MEYVIIAPGIELAETFFPEGTTAGISLVIVHRNEEVYGKDADHYNPDRWLTSDETRRTAMERAFLGLGAGKRICMGRHFAQLEMKKLLPRILMGCDVRSTTLWSRRS